MLATVVIELIVLVIAVMIAVMVIIDRIIVVVQFAAPFREAAAGDVGAIRPRGASSREEIVVGGARHAGSAKRVVDEGHRAYLMVHEGADDRFHIRPIGDVARTRNAG